jgi:hypothetical protein
VLQAADVLLYQATHVPVGEDQKQHLELARDIAQKFNNDFASEDAPVFTLPDPIIPPQAARIMSLRDGSAKMSKSDPSDMSRINLVDDADTIMAKIKKAKTDPSRCPKPPKASKAGPRRAIWWASMPRWPGPTWRACWPSLAARASASSSRAGRPAGREAGADGARYRELREDRRAGRHPAQGRGKGARTGHPDARRGLSGARPALTGWLANWPAGPQLPNSEGRLPGRLLFRSPFRIFSGVCEYHSNSIQPLAGIISPC